MKQLHFGPAYAMRNLFENGNSIVKKVVFSRSFYGLIKINWEKMKRIDTDFKKSLEFQRWYSNGTLLVIHFLYLNGINHVSINDN